VSSPAAGVDVATYSVGDYVYTKPGRAGGAPRLARIESAHPLTSNAGQLWLVRHRMRSGWASGELHSYIDRALSAAEVAHCRRLGLIPEKGGDHR
jgi:hypothetical protein